ncbi:MAG: transglycosylase SLT domain-containing protein [Thermodesulfovibrionia bacterium]|nr:transglycosylase SLT domain-containing protein [Thermodesulfovibrionia bacterium]
MLYFTEMVQKIKKASKIPYIILLITPLAWWAPSYADIYKYVDENGVVYFTNIPKDNKYKKIISEDKTTAHVKKNAANPSQYKHIIYNLSRKYNIKPSLVKALIKVESDWDTNALSKKGAIGLMQLMPSTAVEMDVKNPYNPVENIEGGIRYLRHLLDKFQGDLNLTLAAYNAGPEIVGKFRDIPPIPETQRYVEKVLSIYNNSSDKTPTIIYKVINSDGSVLYTNTPFYYALSSPSEF